MSYMSSIPYEIDEAAKIDGCGFFRIYWNIIFPLLKPLVATVGLLSFRAAWNDYMLPMIFTLANPQKSPLIVGVVSLRNSGEAASSWNLMLAGTTIAIVPMLIVYLFLNRYFIEGLTSGAVKG
jgi:ABC-type glycerol-3-phosphate transport system permease component